MKRRLVMLAAGLVAAVLAAAGLVGCSESPHASVAGQGPHLAWQTDDVMALAGVPSQGGPLAGYVFQPGNMGDLVGYVFEAKGTQHVIYQRLSDHHLYELWWDTAGRHTDDLTVATGAPPAGGGDIAGFALNAEGTQYVIYEAPSDHHIHELWSNATGWHTEDLTLAAGAPAPDLDGPLVGYAFESDGTRHVIYQGASDRHIDEIWRDRAGWHSQDLTAATGAPRATGGLAAYAFEAQGTQHVIYEGVSDRHLHELWAEPPVFSPPPNGTGPSTTWHTDDLTALADAPPVGGPIAAYVSEAQGTQHVVYVGQSDKHIYQVSWDAAGRHVEDLTAATGAPEFGEGLAAYSFEAQGTQHVIYGDVNYPSHLHELWSDGRGWHSDDLTAATGAPPGGGACQAYGAPCGGLPAYAFEAQGTQHVFYVSYVDDHIHELWWGPTQGQAAPTVAGPAAPTRVVDEVAVDSSGRPASGYREISSPAFPVVDCQDPSPSAVDGNIYSCGPTAAAADVCWPASGLDLLCMNDPWSRELHRIRANAPLPQVSPPDLREPVALQLEDGNRCRLRNGGAWDGRDDGYVGAYRCGGDVAVLVQQHGNTDPIDRSAPVWTVKLGRLGPPGQPLPPPTTVNVVTAFFAAT